MFNLHQKEFVVLDVETTGLSPANGDRIIEIAALKIKNGRPSERFHSLVNPERPISYGAFLVNQISQEMVELAPTAFRVLPAFVEFVEGAGLIGHNIQFDLGFIRNELFQMGKGFNEDVEIIDTLRLARKVVPGLSSYSLGWLAGFFQINYDQQHRAMADVEVTWQVLLRLLEQTKNSIAREE